MQDGELLGTGRATATSAHHANAPCPPADVHDVDLAVLLRLAAGGEVEAMDGFYDLTCDRAYGLACRLLGSEADAEALLRDAYLAAWRSLPVSLPQPGSESLWFLSTVLEQHSIALDRRDGAGSAK